MKEESFFNSNDNVRKILLVQFNVCDVAEKLLEFKLFTEEETQEITSKEKDLDQKRSLIDILTTKGAQGIRQFARAAEDLGITVLYDKLRPALESLVGEESDERLPEADISDGHGSEKAIKTPKEVSEIETADGNGPSKAAENPKEIPENVNESSGDSGATAAERQQQPDINPADFKVFGIDLNHCYQIWKYSKRGHIVVINNKTFTKKSGFGNRRGSDIDRDAVVHLFSELGFDVEIHNDLTLDKMEKCLKKAGAKSYTGEGCFALCILSHGDDGVIHGTDGKELKIRQISEYFRDNESLVGKPKLFFFQACQGGKYMSAATVVADCGACDDIPLRDIEMSLPIEADILYAYSTVPGYYAWRNDRRGSWFIQAICEVFSNHADAMDILRMLTRANRIVSRREANANKQLRQIPSMVSQLRKEFYFFPPQWPLQDKDAVI